MMTENQWNLPNDGTLNRAPRWREVPILLYNIWAALDELVESAKRTERTAEKSARRAEARR